MRFDVKALRAPGTVVAMTLDASDELDARAQAAAQGFSVLTIQGRRGFQGLNRPRGGSFHLLLFSQELLALVGAGLSLVESLETLAEKEASAESAKIMRQIVASLYEGRPLSQALQGFPRVFPPLYVATVRASERTGDLDQSLERFITYQTQLDLVRKKVVSASIYPLLLIGVGGLVTLFLLGYVVPRFSRIYEEMGTDLPLLSRMLLEWGKFLERHGLVVLTGFAVVVGLAVHAATRASVRERLLAALWRIPALGARMRLYQLARFYRTLGMLLRGGTSITQAIRMVSDLLQPTLRTRLEAAARSIGEGRSISHAMEEHGLTTPVSVRMLRVGERTGRMGEMMDRIAAFYDEDMARWVDWFTRLFEPLLMAFIGLVIGMIVVLMYFPIFELAGSLQ